VQRHGTVLVADNFTWDVVPACSGSTSLQVLLASTVIWCGIQPGLNAFRKLLCVLGAIPLALLVNGVRVAALTYLGTIYLRPVEGLLHNLIGVAALMLGMGVVILLTSLATPATGRTSKRRPLQGGVLLVLLLLLYAPALTWIVAAWLNSPLDRSGPWFMLAGIGCLLLVLRKHPGHHAVRHDCSRVGPASETACRWKVVAEPVAHQNAASIVAVAHRTRSSSDARRAKWIPLSGGTAARTILSYARSVCLAFVPPYSHRGQPHHAGHVSWPRAATVLFAASLLLLAMATMVDISLLKAAALMLSWFALVFYFRGPRVAGCCLPALAICYLGLPTVTYQLNSLGIAVLGPGWTAPADWLKLGFAALALLLSWCLIQRARGSLGIANPAPSLQPLLYLALAGVVLQAYLLNSATLPSGGLGLELSHFQGDWNGKDLPVSPVAEQIIGRERIISRRYTKEDRWVELLISSTGGDRRRAHSPEYCMTGNGWRIKDRSTLQLSLPIGPIEATLMTLSREGSADRLFGYWFSDGKGSWASFSGLLGEDATRRLKGRITDWHVFRLIAADEADLREFAQNLRFRFHTAPAPRDKLCASASPR
jgi:EpsI family protein